MFNKNGEWTHDHIIKIKDSVGDGATNIRVVHVHDPKADWTRGRVSHTSEIGKAALQLKGPGIYNYKGYSGKTHQIEILSHKLVKPDYKGKKIKTTYYDPLQEAWKQFAVFKHSPTLDHQEISRHSEPREAHDNARRYSAWHNTKAFVINLANGRADGIYDSGKNTRVDSYINEAKTSGTRRKWKFGINPAKADPESLVGMAYGLGNLLNKKNYTDYPITTGTVRKGRPMSKRKINVKKHIDDVFDKHVNTHLHEGLFTPPKKIDMTGTDDWSPEKHDIEAAHHVGLANAHQKSGKVGSGLWALWHRANAEEHRNAARSKSRMKRVNEDDNIDYAALRRKKKYDAIVQSNKKLVNWTAFNREPVKEDFGTTAATIGAVGLAGMATGALIGKLGGKIKNRLDGTTEAIKASKEAIASSFRGRKSLKEKIQPPIFSNKDATRLASMIRQTKKSEENGGRKSLKEIKIPGWLREATGMPPDFTKDIVHYQTVAKPNFPKIRQPKDKIRPMPVRPQMPPNKELT